MGNTGEEMRDVFQLLKRLKPVLLPGWVYWSLVGVSSLAGFALFLAVMWFVATSTNML